MVYISGAASLAYLCHQPAQFMHKPDLTGAVLVLLGAIFLSSKAVIVKLAYQYDIDSISLLTLRFLFALPVFLVVARWSRVKHAAQYPPLRRRDMGQIILFGVAGYYLASLLDFLGLQYVTASMERLLLFAYPTFVVIINSVVLRQPVQRIQLWALLLTYAGITLAFVEGIQLSADPYFALGAGLVLLCAVMYAVYMVGSGHLLPRIGTWRYTSMAMSAACGAILLHHLIVYQWDLWRFPVEVYYLSFLMAMVATVLPAFLVSEGIRRVGASNAAILGSVGPISTIILASIFLDERLGWWQFIGTILVIGGVVLIALNRRHRTSD